MKRIPTVLLLLVLAACGGDGGGGGGASTPGTISLGSTTYDVTEGATINIMVTRSGGSAGVASVDYATSDGTAVSGTDYPATSGTLTFADGVFGNQTISIHIIADNRAEVAETFVVALSNVSGATLGANSFATVNIVNAATELLIPDGSARDIIVAVLEEVTKTVEVIDDITIRGLPLIASAIRFMTESAGIMGGSTYIVACDDGEASVTWNDADNNLVISTGDTFDIVSDWCLFPDRGTWFGGSMSVTNLVVTGDPFNQIAPWGLALTVGLEALPVSGDLDFDMNSEDNVVVDSSLATDSWSAADVSFNPHTLSDFVLTETRDLNALTQVVNTSGTFTNPYSEGTVVFETLQDFVIVADDNPSAGQLLISDSSSSVLVTVLDNINVQFDIDIDLDGTIDQTIVVTWTELVGTDGIG